MNKLYDVQNHKMLYIFQNVYITVTEVVSMWQVFLNLQNFLFHFHINS